mgnify:CR=1 FL=1
MDVYNIIINEDQLRIIHASILKVLNDEVCNPGAQNLTEDEVEDLDLIARMIMHIVEYKETEVTHGTHAFCY